MRSTGKVCLTSSAKLEGDLYTSRLEVADGAVFVGRCVVGSNGGAKPTPRGTHATSILLGDDEARSNEHAPFQALEYIDRP